MAGSDERMGERSQLRVDLVAFDMGGTTVRDDGVVPHALRRALEPLGIRPSDAEVATVRGAAKREAIAALIRRAAGEPGGPDVEAATEATYRRLAAGPHAAD